MTKHAKRRAARFAAGHVVETPAIHPKIEQDYEDLARNVAEAVRLADEEDYHREAMTAAERALIDVEKKIEASRFALACSILEATHHKIPAINQWHRIADAPWQVRSGNRVFALVPAKDADIPTEVDGLPEALTIAIIDLAPEARS